MKSLGRTSRLILTVLAREPSHGYGVIQWAKEVSGGTEILGVGSVYGNIDKLQERGLIEFDRDAHEGGRKRRYFRITERGQRALEAEITRLQVEVTEAQQALNARAPRLAPGS